MSFYDEFRFPYNLIYTSIKYINNVFPDQRFLRVLHKEADFQGANSRLRQRWEVHSARISQEAGRAEVDEVGKDSADSWPECGHTY